MLGQARDKRNVIAPQSQRRTDIGLFRNRTGMTLTEYLSDRQYEKSRRLLRETDDPIETVAVRCGFATASSFPRFFKKKSGMAPRVYRQSAVSASPSRLPPTV